MVSIPSKVRERLSTGLKRFAPIVSSAKARDVNEADTVTIVKDVLSELLGYDKYAELTSEHAIRGTFCDLAIKLDGDIKALIEVKAIGLELKEAHVKQAVDYAANQGVDWVILTNGGTWRIYKVIFSKPVVQELVVEFDFLQLNPRSESDLEMLFLTAREGWVKSVLGDYHTQRQALSRFFIGGMLLTKPVLETLRRELRRVSPDVKVTVEDIEHVLTHEVIKREVLEGDKAADAKKRIARAADRPLRAVAQKEEAQPVAAGAPAAPSGPDPSQVTAE